MIGGVALAPLVSLFPGLTPLLSRTPVKGYREKMLELYPDGPSQLMQWLAQQHMNNVEKALLYGPEPTFKFNPEPVTIDDFAEGSSRKVTYVEVSPCPGSPRTRRSLLRRPLRLASDRSGQLPRMGC